MEEKRKLAETIQQGLAGEGYSAQAAFSAEEAQRFVASLVPEFGANIIDRTFVSGPRRGDALRRAELSGRLRHLPDTGAARGMARDQLHAKRLL